MRARRHPSLSLRHQHLDCGAISGCRHFRSCFRCALSLSSVLQVSAFPGPGQSRIGHYLADIEIRCCCQSPVQLCLLHKYTNPVSRYLVDDDKTQRLNLSAHLEIKDEFYYSIIALQQQLLSFTDITRDILV